MARKKGKKQKVNLIPEGESRSCYTYAYPAEKSAKMISEQRKLRLRKYNPVKRQHEWFVEVKLPRHTK
jgi:large subunit ribosomal protein L33